MERNIMGEFDMYRQAVTKPNFTDIARRYGMHRHTVVKYWRAGGQVEDARRCRPSGPDRHRELIEAKVQLTGATKRGIYEYLLDRCYAGEEPPAYNTLTKWMRFRSAFSGAAWQRRIVHLERNACALARNRRERALLADPEVRQPRDLPALDHLSS